MVPLDQLDQQLQRLEADNLGEHLLDPSAQPEELRSIAIAFNNLQQRLAAAWKRERAFVDGVAHELRTPITVISGHAQRLQRQSLPESAQRSADRVSAEALRMTRLLRVLRDLALIDAGRVQLHARAWIQKRSCCSSTKRCRHRRLDVSNCPNLRRDHCLRCGRMPIACSNACRSWWAMHRPMPPERFSCRRSTRMISS